MKGVIPAVALASALLGRAALGVDVNVDDDGSLKTAASTIAYGLMRFYTGNNTGDVPGNLPDPYYWWTAGAMFGTMIDYWFLTGDSTYNDETLQAIVHQGAPSKDFMPLNQTRTEGNDDQGFWAMTAMTAAEYKFPDPPSDQVQYLALAQAVFNQYVKRWDDDDCGGGLRWQIFSFNNGYNYKNSISNGCFFNIAARLARYTGNATYSDWATKVFEWEQRIGLISGTYDVFDGVSIDPDKSCKSVNQAQWSYNAGVYLHGAANMYNISGDGTWKQRLDGLLKETQARFVKDGILYEEFCEPNKVCNNDQEGFKGFLARWLAQTTRLAPYTTESIAPVLKATARAAAAACTGSPPTGYKGPAGTACGFSWLNNGAFDGVVGVPSQMDGLAAMIAPLAERGRAPFTAKTGGTSKGNPGAGSGEQRDPRAMRPITAADRFGAGLITLLFVVAVMGGTAFLVM
ncbi:Mannan endo-1,6-alpha-mannosidase DCW1 [Tolypocladium capitatum]|uniref:Mannan endo-1,6-alpha-mannosidase n=1 Tax=Tolypocladium capitatum TaxID=45235 RepID=A0A2K3QCQ3_9HYPO|nr:Mannan endo-1,6-alpha-mannosidase DCW1 [Tolypocladium capitatum]